MWPKLLAQFLPQMFELLPHLRRVVPLAESFLTSKAANERANEAALTAMAEGMRGDLGQMVSAHSGLYRKMEEIGVRLGEVEVRLGDVGTEAKRARMAVESTEARIGVLEKSVAAYRGMAIATLVMLAVVLILLVVVYLRTGAGR